METVFDDAARLHELAMRWDLTIQQVLYQVADHLRVNDVLNGVHSPYTLEQLTASVLDRKASQSSFVVISSIASGGKSTIGRMLESIGFTRMPLVTTRDPRPGEIPGHAYEFVSPSDFERDHKAGEFLHVEEVYGKRGIRKSTFDAMIEGGRIFYCEGDALSYHVMRQTHPEYAGLEYLSLFLNPDSFQTAVARLHQRIRNDIENGANEVRAYSDVGERLEKSIFFLRQSGNHIVSGAYDGYLVNDNRDRVYARLTELFSARLTAQV